MWHILPIYNYVNSMLTLKKNLPLNLNYIGQHCDCKYHGNVL